MTEKQYWYDLKAAQSAGLHLPTSMQASAGLGEQRSSYSRLAIFRQLSGRHSSSSNAPPHTSATIHQPVQGVARAGQGCPTSHWLPAPQPASQQAGRGPPVQPGAWHILTPGYASLATTTTTAAATPSPAGPTAALTTTQPLGRAAAPYSTLQPCALRAAPGPHPSTTALAASLPRSGLPLLRALALSGSDLWLPVQASPAMLTSPHPAPSHLPSTSQASGSSCSSRDSLHSTGSLPVSTALGNGMRGVGQACSSRSSQGSQQRLSSTLASPNAGPTSLTRSSSNASAGTGAGPGMDAIAVKGAAGTDAAATTASTPSAAATCTTAAVPAAAAAAAATMDLSAPTPSTPCSAASSAAPSRASAHSFTSQVCAADGGPADQLKAAAAVWVVSHTGTTTLPAPQATALRPQAPVQAAPCLTPDQLPRLAVCMGQWQQPQQTHPPASSTSPHTHLYPAVAPEPPHSLLPAVTAFPPAQPLLSASPSPDPIPLPCTLVPHAAHQLATAVAGTPHSTTPLLSLQPACLPALQCHTQQSGSQQDSQDEAAWPLCPRAPQPAPAHHSDLTLQSCSQDLVPSQSPSSAPSLQPLACTTPPGQPRSHANGTAGGTASLSQCLPDQQHSSSISSDYAVAGPGIATGTAETAADTTAGATVGAASNSLVQGPQPCCCSPPLITSSHTPPLQTRGGSLEQGTSAKQLHQHQQEQQPQVKPHGQRQQRQQEHDLQQQQQQVEEEAPPDGLLPLRPCGREAAQSPGPGPGNTTTAVPMSTLPLPCAPNTSAAQESTHSPSTHPSTQPSTHPPHLPITTATPLLPALVPEQATPSTYARLSHSSSWQPDQHLPPVAPHPPWPHPPASLPSVHSRRRSSCSSRRCSSSSSSSSGGGEPGPAPASQLSLCSLAASAAAAHSPAWGTEGQGQQGCLRLPSLLLAPPEQHPGGGGWGLGEQQGRAGCRPAVAAAGSRGEGSGSVNRSEREGEGEANKTHSTRNNMLACEETASSAVLQQCHSVDPGHTDATWGVQAMALVTQVSNPWGALTSAPALGSFGTHSSSSSPQVAPLPPTQTPSHAPPMAPEDHVAVPGVPMLDYSSSRQCKHPAIMTAAQDSDPEQTKRPDHGATTTCPPLPVPSPTKRRRRQRAGKKGAHPAATAAPPAPTTSPQRLAAGGMGDIGTLSLHGAGLRAAPLPLSRPDPMGRSPEQGGGRAAEGAVRHRTPGRSLASTLPGANPMPPTQPSTLQLKTLSSATTNNLQPPAMSASCPMTDRVSATWGGRGHEGTGEQHPVQLGVLGPDPREEAVRRTQLRVEAYRQVKAETAAQAALAEAARKQAAAEARQAVKAVKERKRAEIYAINAVLKLSDLARAQQLLAGGQGSPEGEGSRPGTAGSDRGTLAVHGV